MNYGINHSPSLLVSLGAGHRDVAGYITPLDDSTDSLVLPMAPVGSRVTLTTGGATDWLHSN